MTIDEMIGRKNELGYSCEKLSELSGVPLGTVQKIFSKVTKRPRHSTISALENILRKRSIRYDEADPDTDSMMVRETAVRYGPGDDTEKDGRHKSVSSDLAEGVWSRQGTYTVDDYLSLPEDVKVELIDGVLYDMSSPSAVHRLSGLSPAFGRRG